MGVGRVVDHHHPQRSPSHPAHSRQCLIEPFPRCAFGEAGFLHQEGDVVAVDHHGEGLLHRQEIVDGRRLVGAHAGRQHQRSRAGWLRGRRRHGAGPHRLSHLVEQPSHLYGITRAPCHRAGGGWRGDRPSGSQQLLFEGSQPLVGGLQLLAQPPRRRLQFFHTFAETGDIPAPVAPCRLDSGAGIPDTTGGFDPGGLRRGRRRLRLLAGAVDLRFQLSDLPSEPLHHRSPLLDAAFLGERRHPLFPSLRPQQEECRRSLRRVRVVRIGLRPRF